MFKSNVGLSFSYERRQHNRSNTGVEKIYIKKSHSTQKPKQKHTQAITKVQDIVTMHVSKPRVVVAKPPARKRTTHKQKRSTKVQ